MLFRSYKALNLDALQTLAEAKDLAKITIADLREAGLIPKKCLVKILGNGQLTRKIEVEADAFSKKAAEAISAAGGTAVTPNK